MIFYRISAARPPEYDANPVRLAGTGFVVDGEPATLTDLADGEPLDVGAFVVAVRVDVRRAVFVGKPRASVPLLPFFRRVDADAKCNDWTVRGTAPSARPMRDLDEEAEWRRPGTYMGAK